MPLLASGRRYLESIDVFLQDPSGIEMARWTRNAVSGPIHVSYHLASETPVGKWRLSAYPKLKQQRRHVAMAHTQRLLVGYFFAKS